MPDALSRQNRAICAVYTGRLNEAKDLLQSLVNDKISADLVVFNLSMTFELLSDRARSMKFGLAEQLAQQDGQPLMAESSLGVSREASMSFGGSGARLSLSFCNARDHPKTSLLSRVRFKGTLQ